MGWLLCQYVTPVVFGGDVRSAGHQGHVLAGVVAGGGGVGRELVPLVAGDIPKLELVLDPGLGGGLVPLHRQLPKVSLLITTEDSCCVVPQID